jgi:hypothetical protein
LSLVFFILFISVAVYIHLQGLSCDELHQV